MMKHGKQTAEQFAIDVQDVMNAQHLTRKELCRRTGIAESYMSRILLGKANLEIRTIVTIVRALGMNLKISVVPKEGAKDE